MKVIYPVTDNSFYITLVDEEFKSIRCIKDYINAYTSGVTYSYRLYKHDETDIMIYVVYKDVCDDSNLHENNCHFFTKDSLAKHFDITSINREEKLNTLGI
jgi:hypothetical protein